MILIQLITSGKDDLFFNLINLALVLLIMFLFIKRYRDLELGGYISFSQSLRYGVSISFFASTLVALYTIVSIEYINPDIVDDTVKDRIELMKKDHKEYKSEEDDLVVQNDRESTDSDSKIIEEESRIRKFFQPHWVLILSILSVTFYGFIYSLIISLFVKKEPSSNNTN